MLDTDQIIVQRPDQDEIYNTLHLNQNLKLS